MFELNLCAVLAHTLVYESRATAPAGCDPQNNSTPDSYQVPNVNDSAAMTMLAQMQAMTGTGRFSKVGALPDLIGAAAPKFTNIALQGQQDYLLGRDGLPGMLELEQTRIAPAMDAINSQSRTSTMNDVARLSPQIREITRDFNPQVTGMLDTLNAKATQDLNLDGALDPFTKTLLQQDTRTGDAARGLGTGYADAAAEAYYQDASRQARRGQAQNFAGTVAQATSSYYGDPFSRLLGITSTGSTGATWNQGAAGAASATNPAYGYYQMPSANALFGTGYSALLNKKIFDASNNNAVDQAIWGGLSSMGSSMVGGMSGRSYGGG